MLGQIYIHRGYAYELIQSRTDAKDTHKQTDTFSCDVPRTGPYVTVAVNFTTPYIFTWLTLNACRVCAVGSLFFVPSFLYHWSCCHMTADELPSPGQGLARSGSFTVHNLFDKWRNQQVSLIPWSASCKIHR